MDERNKGLRTVRSIWRFRIGILSLALSLPALPGDLRCPPQPPAGQSNSSETPLWQSDEVTPPSGRLALALPVVGLSTDRQVIASRLLRAEMTLPGDQLRLQIQKRLAQLGVAVPSELDELMAALSACTTTLVREAATAEDAAIALAGGPAGLTHQLLRFSGDPAKFEMEFPVLAETIKAYLKKSSALLTQCYRPAEESAFLRNSKLSARVGAIYEGETPTCTALLVGDGEHILTARHCFAQESSNTGVVRLPLGRRMNIWFRPMGSPNRYQICALAEPNALNAKNFEKHADDQVVARITRGLPAQLGIRVSNPNDLRAIEDLNTSQSLTRLTIISAFPNARTIDSRYMSGLVEPLHGSCFLFERKAGCFLHLCSAVAGGSGSTIFLEAASSPTIVGTHIGFNTEPSTDCPDSKSSRMNVGTYLNPVWKAAIGGNR